MQNGLTKEDVMEIKDSFDLFDINGEGLINPGELAEAMIALNIEPDSQVLFKLLRDVGHDGKADISFDDYYDFTTLKIDAREQEEDLVKVFDMFGKGDGKIQFKDFRRAVKELGDETTEEELQELFERADVEGKGFVSVTDFQKIMSNKSIQ